jgi:hypothetical protein
MLRASWAPYVVAALLLAVAVAPPSPQERDALVALFNSTMGTTWSPTVTGWPNYSTQPDPCNPRWTGVTCSPTNTSVM